MTPIKPSEAIRLGCLLAPVQTFHEAYVDWSDPRKACAYGAMALGFGGYDNARELNAAASRLHCKDMLGSVLCPGCDLPLLSITHLNDDHRWSRERIADWLEGMGL